MTQQREIKFRAYHKDLAIMLFEFQLAPDRSVSMAYDSFVEQVGKAYEVSDGEVRTVLSEEGNSGGEVVTSFMEGDDWVFIDENQVIVTEWTGIEDFYEGDRIEEDGMKGTIIFQAGAFMIEWDMDDVLCDPLGFDKQNRSRMLKLI